jgi:hypothetical protein
VITGSRGIEFAMIGVVLGPNKKDHPVFPGSIFTPPDYPGTVWKAILLGQCRWIGSLAVEAHHPHGDRGRSGVWTQAAVLQAFKILPNPGPAPVWGRFLYPKSPR